MVKFFCDKNLTITAHSRHKFCFLYNSELQSGKPYCKQLNFMKPIENMLAVFGTR